MSAPTRAPFPVGEKLEYGVSWMGIKCGHMEIVAFVDSSSPGAPLYRIALFARTTKFFDGIYRVRTRLDSTFDPIRSASTRYEERSLEKKRHKHEVWEVDFDAGEVARTKGGSVTRIAMETTRANDPLAFIYRLRSHDVEIGGETVLTLMTSKGAVETVTRATEAKELKTKNGRCRAVSMVPEPRDRMMFSKSGSMAVWIDQEEPRRPCRIEFDLAFGKLVANLREVTAVDQDEIGPILETWLAAVEEER